MPTDAHRHRQPRSARSPSSATDGALTGRLHGRPAPPARHRDLRRTGDAGDPPRRRSSQLEEYFAGELHRVRPAAGAGGHPFQQRVWAALRTSRTARPGPTASSPQRSAARARSRAVGLANGRNPIGIIVPCHRVVGADGSLTGYGGGLERKRLLLDLESRVAGHQLF